MATTRADILGWLNRGKNDGATHVVVVCDTFDYEDYPVFCKSESEARLRVANPGSMQRVMEVYNLSLPFDAQLNEHRSFNF